MSYTHRTLASTRGTLIIPLIFIELLGAFTTFYIFSNETLDLLRGGKNLVAFGYIAGYLILGLARVWLGRGLGRAIASQGIIQKTASRKTGPLLY